MTPTATPTTTRTATPTPTATSTPGPEICDNCVDDDGNDLVDRDDPGCSTPADGAGQGLGDAARAKRLVKCAGAIEKSGAKLENKRLKRLQKCVNAVFACVQLKSGNAACLTKAQKTCDKAIAALPADGTALSAKIGKSCKASLVDGADLLAATGLGFSAQVSPCALVGAAAPTDAASVAACVALEHACRADAALGIQVPRAAELLGLVGHSAGELPCLPAGSGAGSGLGDSKRGKLAVKCEKAIKKAAAKLVSTEVKSVPKCANAVLTCVQLKPTDTKCLPKARTKCTKTIGKVTGLGAKLAAAVTKACQASGLTLADALDASGVGLDALAPACAAADVPSLASIGNVATCLTTYHHCRAQQMIESQLPRLQELLGLGQVTLP